MGLHLKFNCGDAKEAIVFKNIYISYRVVDIFHNLVGYFL